jgi:phage N-6-adenine-methyltransferase
VKRKGKTIAAGDSQQCYETPWSHVRAVERDSFDGRPFDLDVAASADNAKADAYYDERANGLRRQWAAPQVWCNPPYEVQGIWLARAVYFAKEYGVCTASLVLASTSALYWRECCHEVGTVDYYEGRIAFIDPATKQPRAGFDRASALVLVGPRFMPGVVRYRDATTGMLISQLPHGYQGGLL